MEGDFDAVNLDVEHKITATPANNANIYVTYTTDHLTNKPLHLQGARPFNIKIKDSSNYLYDANGTLKTDEDSESTDANHLWYIAGGDPYAVTVQNGATSSKLTYKSAAFGYDGTVKTFIMKSASVVDATHTDVTLWYIDGENLREVTVTVNTVVLPIAYTLIDRKGKVIEKDIRYVDAEGFGLPAAWKSPLATYHYWNTDAFVVSGTPPDVTYVLVPEASEITSVTQVKNDNVIYVTYDVNNSLLDLDGRNSLGIANKTNKTYMLQFQTPNTDEYKFYQEDGKDGVMTEKRRAVYPYSNGDASLYVYGDDQWNAQLASGATTRTRWLWYIEPANSPASQAELDPYHVRISSYQAQTNKSWKVTEGGKEVTKTSNFHSYLHTYKPDGYSSVVTGVTNSNPLVHNPDYEFPTTPPSDLNSLSDPFYATEYMILGTSLSNLKLQTTEKINDGTTTERRVVNSFEQYWKNDPTVQGKLPESKKVTTVGRNVILSDDQKSEITGWGWHVYKEWANSAPWKHNNDGGGGTAHTTSKKFLKEEHVYQTVNMGETFRFVETEIKPMLILLDQHGWEIVRLPLPSGPDDPKRAERYADLHKYSSPMVERYHFWKTGSKIPGYHKYKVSDYATNTDGSEYTADELGRADLAHSTPNLPDYATQAFVGGKERDWYVTYDVKDEYANRYPAAATKPESSVPYLIKQNGLYAQYSGSGTSISTTGTKPDIMAVPVEMQWYLMRNFDIDEEMGYLYKGEDGAQEDAKSKADTELDYFDHTREGAVPTWSNGFDPYNVQIKSAVPETDRYFTANTTGSTVTSSWAGTSSSISLQNMGVGQPGVRGLDQTKMKVTNATFMVVDDGNGNMRLMPRFDNTKVMENFTDLAAQRAAADKEDEGTGIQTLYLTAVPKVVNKSSDINAMGGYYILSYPFTASGSIGTKDAPFKGTIEGDIDKSFDVSEPFIAYADGAVIKNVIIGTADGVSSESSDVVVDETDKTALGAICNVAQGNTRIYNCGINGGSVGASADYVGGIVGLLDGYSRVINCYSYANVGGGTNVGGIVGYNNYASTADNIRTMVMNCMFYGDIESGTTKSPVYGGYNIANLQGGLNTFNYYAYQNLPTDHITNGKYNSALAVEDKFLNRFEFYRLLLNSNKKLAAFYATGSADDADKKMAKWVLETADRTIDDPKPYPVLKAQGYYPSIINYDTRDLANYSEENRNQGLKTGTLSVTVSGGGVGSNAPSGASITTGSLTLTRTDKDFDHFNFNYDKVQLPYYNDVGTGNYTENKVVTGWKITAITAVDGDPYTAANYPTTGVKDFPDHNYADRKSSNKDLYSVSKRVFSQGAYFDVPYGVTSITIEPYWGNAIYVADQYYDVVYKNDYTGKQGVSQVGKQAVDNTTTFNGQKVRTSITGLGSGATVYDNAVVLVGNFHLDDVPTGKDGTTPFTMMSVDQDNDHEPDYSLIYHHKGRTAICPIRFDFLNIPGTAQAQKPNNASLICNFTIFKTKGWFEVTNTSSFYTSQVEYENLDGVTKTDAPLILQGGVIDQFVSTQSKTVAGKTIYIHVGGNVWIKEFGMGTHSDGSQSTPHVPVSVTGGEFPGFYLTGTYNANAAVRTDNAECYISGGHFGEVAGASLEQIDGNVHWQIYNADIDEFFGGGINEAKPIKGDITTDIFNSHVTLFCGGPKFGNMAANKTVTTNATGCTFGKYFGAGYGGTSLAKKKYYDKDDDPVNWNNLQNYYATNDRGKYFDGGTTNSRDGGSGNDQYGKKGLGVATDFDYEYFVWSSGKTGGRFYVKFASFSLAQCNDVNSTLTGCTINESFYGGGSLGKVVGKATSVLNRCTVHGNVFGGGYSATLPPIQVRNAGFAQVPNYNKSSGMFEPGVFSGTREFTWKNAEKAGVTLKNGESGSDLDNHYVYTNADLTVLGQVKETDLTVQNNCLVEGGIYGGGDESAVNENTLVKIDNVKTSGDAQNTIPNVYGGGNTADVEGNTEVRVMSGTVSQDVYGGGRGKNTVVVGDVLVNIGEKTGELPKGTGTVTGNVYGGSALGAVNASATKNEDGDVTAYTPTANKTTKVNIYAGTVDGSVFGGGLGYDDEDEAKDIVARNFGATTVNMEGGAVKKAVYGGANVNGVLKGGANVNVQGGTVRTAPASAPASASDIKNAVFGGGYGEPTIVEGDIAVTIGTQAATPDNSKPTVYGSVYGGSALGKVQVNEADEDQLAKKIDVNLYGGTIQGNVFGGGLGRKAAAAVGVEGTPGYVAAVTAVEARVGGNVNVLLDGAKFDCKYTGEGDNRMPLTGQIFGANNLNGTPKGHVKVHVKRTVDSEKDTEVARDSRTTYDVAAVYGGGNQADYIPVDPTPETPLNDTEDYAEVLIEGCDLTSIEYVYGGGNAAAVPATKVTILGDYIIDYVFGGGNGKSTATFTNPGANVGQYNNGATDYGTGKAVTNLVGCHIHYVFGGSNTKGNVRGGTSVSMPESTPYPAPTYDCCAVRDVKEIYGAGNEADQDGTVTLVLGCVNNMDYVYGGARNAHVKGGVDLVVTSGSFKGVYGGNDTSGSIQGPITVTIEETGCDPLIIDNLYLGGKDAAYSIYGYKNTGTEEAPVLVARTKKDYDALTQEQKEAEGLPYRDPVLNIVSCTRIGKESGEDLGGAFGGGYGAGATLHGNPTVNVNMIAGKYAKDIDRDGTPGADNDATALGIVRNVYGGGEQADVEGNTQVNIGTETTVKLRSDMGAPIPEESQTPTSVLGALITDNVFGAGKGKSDDIESAFVTGNTTVNICTADYSEVAGFKGISIAKSVYGGGQLSQVGGTANITVSGGTIGTEGQGGATYGNIYGGGFGHNANVRFGLVKGNTNVTVTGGNVLHSVYGGGAYGSVGTYTYASDAANAAISALASENTTEENTTGVAKITITGGTIGTDGHENGMVFGSSRGDIAAPDAIQDNMAWVYDTKVVIGTENDETPGPRIHGSLYGSGENGHTFHNASVTMYSGTIGNPEEFYSYRGNVYGGGCGTDKYYADPAQETHDGHGTLFNPKAGIVKGNASVEILGGSVANNIYGAGAMGKVEGNTSVTINTKGSVGVDGNHDDGNVYGAARGELGLSNDYASVTNSSVTITKGTVKGSVYGGGRAGIVTGQVVVNLNGGTVEHDAYGGGALAKTNTEYDAEDETKKTYVTQVNLAGTAIYGNLYGGGLGRLASVDPALDAVAADVDGPVTVTVTKGIVTNVFGCNNVNGSPQSTVTVNINGTDDPDPVTRPLPISNIYGGGNMAAYTYMDPSHPQNLQVNIAGGTMDNVFGGGLSADVYGGINVKVSGGTIKNDVYGGGALANTNTGNTLEVPGDNNNYYFEVKHLKYVEDDPENPEKASSVVGYYENPDGTGLTSDTKASKTKTYYKQTTLSEKAYRDVNNGTKYKTTVSLTGGIIGNAYGGGLGQLTSEGETTGEGAVQAMVYGDVDVTVNGAAFTQEVEASAKNAPKTGRVFGSNNVNGTPKGHVTVTVNSTRRIDGGNHTLGEFEIQGVYGGGNLANYVPETFDKDTQFGQRSRVIIDGCETTSISKVYGGGNAAVVPYTDVTIKGAFEIGYVFGGGNGGDMIYKNGAWIDNPGADVPGYTYVLLKGGTIGQAFGGSDSRGTVGGSEIRQETGGSCPLRLVNLYGAGNGEEASSVGDITVDVSGCGEYSEIQNVFGGSYKANITGNITLNIKSGIFTSVYGGNDRMGSIGGNITINIEETDNCDKPIIIQNLYGGCYQTPYPGANARTYKGSGDVKDPANYVPFTSGKLTVNVKSATRIDKIYGGSEEGDVTGDTEININMIKGSMSGHSYVTLPSYYAETGASIPENITVDPVKGWIVAHVYIPTSEEAAAGRERSSVEGYYTKDIFTSASGTAVAETTYYKTEGDGDYTIALVEVGADVSSYYTKSEGDYVSVSGKAKKGYTYYKQVVQGTIADKIGTIGDVFGGGNLGKVDGSTNVNIGTATSVTMVTDGERVYPVLGANITGDVFGGGNQADVTGNTDLNIGVAYNEVNSRYEAVAEGTDKVRVDGDVFGGGKGIADAFKCDKGMIGVVDTNTGDPEDYDKGTHVRIGNGTIGKGTTGGNVYGGGKVGRVEFHTKVTVGYAYGATSTPDIKGSVFGAGQGLSTHGYAALVRGNTTVTVDGDAKIGKSIYGGGEIASVGRYTVAQTAEEAAAHNVEIGMPYSLADGGSGICTVTVGGNAEVGPDDMVMPQFSGNVFGGGKGVLPYEGFVEPNKPWRILPSGASEYYSDDVSYLKYVETLALATKTDVAIGGNAFIKGSVYGGSENGIVQHDTHVLISGGQIGNGSGTGKNARFDWSSEVAANFSECASWVYGLDTDGDGNKDLFAPYDKYADATGKYPDGSSAEGGRLTGSDGHTYYGNVYGGGSGKDPYKPGKWHRKAGFVGGNTQVDITGGHIVTSLYGGNEMTDVGIYSNDGNGEPTVPVSKGKCTINMVGGTLGIPRTPERMIEHPVTCYLFGAGKGDQRIFFNTWTNVIETEVNISGTARIFGSSFGGGEDGHVITNALTNIGGTAKIDLNGDGDTGDSGETFTADSEKLKIGTTGTSYVDGNVFGGGRGYSGTALTAGSVGGNITVNVTNGTMLGNIYGGGRLASVGLFFTSPTNDNYAQLQDGAAYGHITIDISGGTIGKAGVTGDGAEHSGNVFGGSMGRLTLLDNTTINPLWPELAQVKGTNINITGGTITRNVYGGGEYGTVREDAAVTVSGGTVSGNVFGGGYGSDDYEHATPIAVKWNNTTMHYVYTPMQWAGMVGGNTTVSVSGGTVGHNVYGGGELASVGIIDCSATENPSGDITAIDGKTYAYNTIVKHTDLTNSFALSWPYQFKYVPNKPNSEEKGGKATVTITGGHVGTALQEDVQGYVYGGGMGKPMKRYIEAFCANVRETEVNIHYPSTTDSGCDIFGAVYGGGENGHVYEDTKVDITGGLIGMSVYAGGKGKDKYHVKIADEQLKDFKSDAFIAGDIYSITAGKVYGNTNLTMSGGHVTRNVYGGGFMASVGKGNYAGGDDDYSKFGNKCGYGEAIEGNLWDGVSPNSQAFLGSGKATITITGGTIGTENGAYGDLPTGNVVGGSRGEAAPNVFNQPVHLYNPTFHVGNINEAEIIIGTKGQATDHATAGTSGNAPRIFASVYGGGQDGHMRRDAKITIYSGEIGKAYTSGDQNDLQWQHRGNVFGSGSGIGKYRFDYQDGKGEVEGLSFLAGCVARFSEVDIQGGIIHRNVYGGGSVAGTGMPKFYGQDYEPYKKGDNVPGKQSMNIVTISGGTIGQEGYGGNVFGASRGEAELVAVENPMFATAIWTEVNIKPNATNRANDPVIYGNVYGGGELGSVKKDTKVSLNGGEIKHNAYGGCKGIKADVGAVEANIGGNTTVELNKGVADDAKGCVVDKLFGCNDLNGTPKGHVLVHVYATQTAGQDNVLDKAALPPSYSANKAQDVGYIAFMEKLIEDVTKAGGLSPSATVITNAQATISGKTEETLTKDDKDAIDAAAKAIDDAMNGLYDSYVYDVTAVYGGGELAPYVPGSDAEKAEVIIEGCRTTSIKQVYGGGNAASVPATEVKVKECYIIDELFGGGNGKDNYQIDEKWYENAGAHVGYEQFATYDTTTGSHGTGEDEENKYTAIVPDAANDDVVGSDAAKAYRQANYRYGTGVASSTINGGHVHKAYGGSNEKGNISGEINSQIQQVGICPIVTDGTYGGSKSADTDATIIVILDCVENGGEFYGGSYKANINSDVNIHITNGHYTKVFGGNDRAGTVNGKITITIEEYGCTPIEIDELYAGGNLAPYSVYGFKTETEKAKDAAGNIIPDLDQRIPYRAGEVGARTTPYWDPRINIISATRIGAIYGGGYGAGATLIGNPHINVNMTTGRIRAKYASDYPSLPDAPDGSGDKVISLGNIGSIYGGGNLASVEGDTYLEIGTGQWIASWDANGNPVWESTTADGTKYSYKEKTPAVYYTQAECNEYNAANVPGYIASGTGTALSAEQVTLVNTVLGTNYTEGQTITEENANVYNSTLMGARRTTDARIEAVWAWYDAEGNEMAAPPALAPRNAANITGNVFGGGKGVAETSGSTAFTCSKGMVGAEDDGLEDPVGGTSVIIANGTVGTLDAGKLVAGTGNVYGGGEMGRVQKNATVTIGVTPKEGETKDNTKFKPNIYGSVFGAGKGTYTHGFSGLVQGNSTVTVQGFAKVGESVYGGGENASVGRYNLDAEGKPTISVSGGKCTVTIADNAEIGPDNMTMTKAGGPDNSGHVFGAGMGVIPYEGVVGTPWSINMGGGKVEYTTDETYLSYLETLALANETEVTIGGNVFVKGDVFGGSENGRVLADTWVKIQDDCQIGAGFDKSTSKSLPKYDVAKFINPLTTTVTEENALAECASWPYVYPYSTYDKFANETGDLDKYPDGTSTEGGRRVASDGHTFYGNVFGGGSGFFPYKPGKWHWNAGYVGGNTHVDITGGHILTNVYGGNEMTNVQGNCTVNMSGGTIGVPRTLEQIFAHPVTCYLYGAGMGDPRIFFNKQTNVNDVEVNISGGIIYGSAFGGGEDGHVMRNVTMNISDGAKIGTWGTSYVDGNVFGGGRGFGGEAYTAGNVAGSVTMNIKGGTMLGSVYGGGRLGSVGYGIYDAGVAGYGEMREDHKMDNGDADGGFFTKGRGHVEISISGDNTVIGNKYEFTGVPTDVSDLAAWQTANHVPQTTYETIDNNDGTYTHRLLHTRGGNVYAGGMGRYLMLDGTTPISTYNSEGNLTSKIEWKKLGNVKSTKLTISGNPWIMGNVYGGGEFGAVQGYHQRYDGETPLVDEESHPIVAGAEILFTGGTIGTEILNSGAPEKETVVWDKRSRSGVQYTFGSIYGGGMGQETPDGTGNHGGDVKDSTYISMSKPGEAATLVRASVFGGGEMAQVLGNTRVNISNGEIGRYEVKPLSDPDAGYVLFGGATMGNVYGGGKGILSYSTAGQVKGNTNVTISGGNVYHIVYGGGALASVGDFKLSKKEGDVYVPSYIPAVNIPYDWTVGTGTATVTITGGVIGISGRDNGLVFGSSRGDLKEPEVDPESDNKLLDPYDKVAWVNKSVVNIGNPETLASPLIKCSVYGGGENGHNDESATVNVYSGTIGITDTEDPWYNFGTNETVRAKAQLNRGNVYGAGSGSDTYKIDGVDFWNPKSGMVGGNTFVNIYGGHIGRSVYGGGAMASVGTITNAADTADVNKAKHKNEATSFALSWPYKFEFQPGTGKATVNVTGGHIGTRQLDGGDVYGSSRGEAGDRYKMAHLAWTNETEVNVTYDETIAMPSEAAIQNDFTKQCITGSVHGSGENGYVYGDTRVTLNEGLIGHSLYGAGKGNGTYTKTLNKLPGSGGGTYDAKIYSLIAGKVMGNTFVTMNGGRVGRNVYGGGNMGSVGKGNYSGGADDYFPTGYGETITGNLWTSASEGDNAWEFLHSGKTIVKVLGGVVGYIDATDPSKSMKNQLPYGNVIGGSAGEAAPNIAEDPRYEYSPAFFSGYVNETDVTIGGGYRCTAACTIGDKAYKVGDSVTAAEYNAFTSGQSNWEAIDAPTILASVYGGSQDGHVRRDSKVTVNNGEIGLPYNDENQAILGSLQLGDGSLNPQWLHRGNVYGGGSGITKYKYDFDHDGKTSEDLNGDGIIEDSEIDTGTYHDKTVKDEDYSSSSGSVTRFAEVNILGGTVHRNVYGGGSLGSVGAPKILETQGDLYKKDLDDTATLGKQSLNLVNIRGQIGTAVSSRSQYGGDVFGAGRGNPSLNVEEFGTSIWTRVNILNGATIFGNVFGGGDAGAVKKDAEVVIGD